MKKILYISLGVLFVIALSACVRNGNAPSDAAPAASDIAEASIAASSEPEPEVSSVESETPSEQVSTSSIIAESSNTVSDKEVQAILDDLSGELDSALNDADNLEDLDDTDLDVNDIG